jgi:hypothetical protein
VGQCPWDFPLGVCHARTLAPVGSRELEVLLVARSGSARSLK